MPNTPTPETVLEVNHLKKYFPIRKGLLRRTVGQVRAVDDVSFHLNQGETLSLVGESGCGKTTTARCILRAVKPTSGEINFRVEGGQSVNVAALPKSDLRPLRPHMQMIFQDPYSSLNPRMTILDIISEPLLVNGVRSSAERRERVEELMQVVGLPAAFAGAIPMPLAVDSASASGLPGRWR